MIEKQPLSDQQRIIMCLNVDYGIEVTTLEFLPLGADMFASVYKAQAIDLTSYFIKIKHGHHHDISVEIAELLRDAGIHQIIPPIRTIHGKPTHRIEDCTLIVYPFVEGKDGFSRDLTDNQWINLGKALRKIHEIDVPLSIQNEIRREAYSPQWRELVRSLYIHNVWNKPHEEKLFYKGYGKTEVNPTILAYYRHERIVEDIALYGQKLLLTTEGGEDRLEMYRHFIAMFEPQGVVDIATKTDMV